MPVTPMSAPTPIQPPGPEATTAGPTGGPMGGPTGGPGVPELAGMDNRPGPGAVGMGGSGGEQRAIQLLSQGAQMFDQAIKLDPGLYFMRDDLEKLTMKVAKYYGAEDEMKMALTRTKEAMRVSGMQNRPPVG